MSFGRKLCYPLLFAAISPYAFAQQLAPEEEAEPLERYQVEVIAFAYADGPTAAGELLQRLPSLPPEPELDESDSDAAAETDDPAPEPPPETIEDEPVPEIIVRFETMLDEELQLVEAYERLEKLSAYDMLLHGGWTQEGVPEEFAMPLDVRLLRAPLSLAGNLTLHKSRFLHVAVDLSFDNDDSRPVVSLDDPFPTVLPPFKLQERRRLRSGELHYFDHPSFGLLVVVRPEPVPEEIPEEEQELPSQAAGLNDGR